jgi:crotonobetainyl-CoA:carnitine CoA-transferase CaiB-like acyl-CoA transferase
MASNAILGALVSRERGGEGQFLEVSLFDNAVLMTGYATLQHLFTGTEPQRHGNTSPDTCPSGVFAASDKSFYINCGNDKIFQRLMISVIQRPDLAADPVLAGRNGRIARRAELFGILNDAFAQQPWRHWQERMRAASIPSGEVRTVGEAMRSPEARDRKIVSRIRHAKFGWLPNVALPIRYSVTPLADPVAAPGIGEHTAEVLHQLLGYDEAKLDALAKGGVINDDAAANFAVAVE